MSKAKEIRYKTVGGTHNASIDCRGWLDSGELLTGTPLIPDVTGITISSKSVSTEELEINGETIPIGMAIQYSVSGGTANTTYNISMTCSTDSTPAQIRGGTVVLKVVPDDE